MHKTLSFLSALAFGALAMAPAASAQVLAHVDISQQTMIVTVDGAVRHVWPVSTARKEHRTPTGAYKPVSLHRMHYSSLYNNAPMPFTIFFHGHYAIHGTTEVKRLGRPASAGCIRLHPDNARALFDLVKERGMDDMQIVLEI